MGWVTNLMDSVAAMFISDIAEIRMFPDGLLGCSINDSTLIPGVAPGMKGFEDVAVTRFDYGALDRADRTLECGLAAPLLGERKYK